MSAYSQEETFAEVKILLSEGPESTQIGHSGSLMRTSTIGPQSGHPFAATSWAADSQEQSSIVPLFSDRHDGIRSTGLWRANNLHRGKPNLPTGSEDLNPQPSNSPSFLLNSVFDQIFFVYRSLIVRSRRRWCAEVESASAARIN